MTKNKTKPAWAVIVGREMQAFIVSPVAYIVIGLFLAFAGFLFFSAFFLMNRADLRDFFSFLPLLFSFFIPALCMRLFAEEKKSGTIETLFTMPVSAFDATLGKFLAAFLFTQLMMLPTISYAVSAALLGDLEAGPVIGGYLGSALLCASYCAIGVYCSARTKNQIIAFFTAFSICILLSTIDKFLIIFPAPVVGFFQFFSAGSHFDAVTKGIIDSRDILYFASLTLIFLWMTGDLLEERRTL